MKGGDTYVDTIYFFRFIPNISSIKEVRKWQV
nr:MAG TPA: hypothetical protein [Caudoviricetes sp.]